ncbi:MAG: hypothetical protein H8F28_19180 [Fibrella sp.]|nr:hypothetical protein [Armatimonadota bacterium]
MIEYSDMLSPESAGDFAPRRLPYQENPVSSAIPAANDERRFRLMADSMPQIAWTARADGGVEHYNQKWYDYSGLTLEQTREWGWQPVIHPDDVENATRVCG